MNYYVLIAHETETVIIDDDYLKPIPEGEVAISQRYDSAVAFADEMAEVLDYEVSNVTIPF